MQPKSVRAPGQIVVCAWCGTTFMLAATGRIPKWCSRSCRQRAWEQRRATESGLAAVEVVVRIVEVEKPALVAQRVEVPPVPGVASGQDALAELVDQLDRGSDLRPSPFRSCSRDQRGPRGDGAATPLSAHAQAKMTNALKRPTGRSPKSSVPHARTAAFRP